MRVWGGEGDGGCGFGVWVWVELTWWVCELDFKTRRYLYDREHGREVAELTERSKRVK